MFQKLILVLLFSCYFQVKSQNSENIEEDESNSISNQLYIKCFENLNQGAEFFEKYPSLKSNKFCCILECMFLLNFEEPEAKLAGESRLRGIATQLYREGNPVYLVMGMDSYLWVKEKNENLEDDNHIVYISYGECTNPPFLIKSAEIVNNQTMLLLHKKKL